MRRSAAVKTSEWCKRFKDGRTSVSDDPDRGGSQPTAVNPVIIQRAERLILDNREIAQETNLSVGTVNTIIQEHSVEGKIHGLFPDNILSFTWTDLKYHKTQVRAALFWYPSRRIKVRSVTGT